MKRFSRSEKNPTASPSATRSAIRTCIIAQAVGAPISQVLINGGVLSLFLLALGGSNTAVGSVFAANFLAQIARVFAAPHIDVANRKRFVFLWMTWGTLLFAGLLLALPIRRFWGNPVAVWLVVGLFLFQRVLVNIGGLAWMSLLSVIIPGALRGRFFAQMRATFQTVSLLLMVLIGAYLGNEPSAERFQMVFFLLIALAAVRPFYLARLPNPAPDRRGPRTPVLENILNPLKDRGWRQFIVFWAFLAFSINLGRPFIVPFLKNTLAFPSSLTAYSSGALLLGMILGLSPWGRIADRLGNKVVFLANILLLSVAFAVLAGTPSYPRHAIFGSINAMAAFFTIGVASGGLGIGHTVRQMVAAPRAERSSYMAIFFTVNGIVGGMATLVAGPVLDSFPDAIAIGFWTLSPMRLFFMAVAILVLGCAALLWRLDSVAEKPIQHALVEFLALFPPSMTYPLRVIDRDPHHDGEKSSRDRNRP